MDYGKKILNELVNKYEKSKSFSGDNRVNQNFTVIPGKLFKKYEDHSDYMTFEKVNEAVRELEVLGYVRAERQVNAVKKVSILLSKSEEIYQYLGRVSKEDINHKLIELFDVYSYRHPLLDIYLQAQKLKLSKNQKVQGFKEDLGAYEDVLKGVLGLLELQTETYERDFSVRVFGDSKKFKTIEARVVSILYDYGDYPDKKNILGELNLIKNPTYVYVKGQGRVHFGDQRFDISKLPSDIAISSENLSEITSIEVLGENVVTVENLTSFHSFPSDEMLVVYLGGFHNRVRRRFLQQIREDNKKVQFLHFGDIDIGGILIFEHLKRKTQIDFKPYEMTKDSLVKYRKFTQELSDNDRKRAERLLEGTWCELVTYMLEHNCKLEQEAIEVKMNNYHTT